MHVIDSLMCLTISFYSWLLLWDKNQMDVSSVGTGLLCLILTYYAAVLEKLTYIMLKIMLIKLIIVLYY